MFVLMAGAVFADTVSVAALDAKIRGMMDENMTVGMSVVVVKGDKVVYQQAFGYRDKDTREPLDVNDIFRIASISKSFSGMSVMQLVEAGKMSLDDDVNGILGMDIHNPRYPDIPVTIKMLLSHTSGMSDGGGYHDLSYVDKTKTDINLIREKAWLTYPPGKGYRYCNRALNIIGLVIEKVSGESYEDYLQKNIFDKLRMTETEVVSDKRPLSGYNVDKKEWRDENTSPLFNNMEFMFSSFGVTSTICDMEKFYDAILDNTLTKTNLLDEIESFNSGYGYGFKHDGKNLFTYGGTSLHTAYAYINTETRELALLCSNRTGKIRINDTGKAVYNAVNSKINGMLLDKNGN